MDKDGIPAQAPTWKSYIEPLAWLGLAVVGLTMSAEFDAPNKIFALGPAFWPQVILVGMIIAAVVLGISIYVSGGKPTEDSADAAQLETSDAESIRFSPRLAAIFILPLIYVYAMHKLGFYLVTPFFLPVYMYMLGVRRWKTLLLVTVGLYATLVLLFVKLIFTPLPQGAGYFHTLNGQLMGLIQ
jgi:hypothetical protein